MKNKTRYSIVAVVTLIAALAFMVTFTGCSSDGGGANNSGSHSSCH